MLRFMFWFRIQSVLGPVIQIYPNQIWSTNYWYRNITSTHTNGYVMLGLCVKPFATSFHVFTTLWIWESIMLPLGSIVRRNHYEVKTFHFLVKAILLNCHLCLTQCECWDTLPRTCGLDPDKVQGILRSMPAICSLCMIDSLEPIKHVEMFTLWTLCYFPQ